MREYYIYLILVIILLFYIFYIIGSTKITVDFENLEPFRHHLPVYYKGFKLGHTTKVRPDRDYQSTLVDLRIVLKNLKLPSNTTAILRRKDKKDYIELTYPNIPAIGYLRHGDVINGTLGLNFERYLQEQANNGGLDEIKANLNNTIVSAGETFNALTDLFYLATDVLSEARPIIINSAHNIEKASDDLSNISTEIKKSVDKGYVNSFLYNLDKTSNNFVLSSNNVSKFTTDLNQESVLSLNCLLKRLNLLVTNINQIVIGVGETLKKRFGALRLIFGKME